MTASSWAGPVGVVTRPAGNLRAGLIRSGVRLSTGVIAALAISHLSVADRPATICPLRALTGIPCPFCGGTTAAVRLGHGQLLAALRSNPFALLAGVVLVAAPTLATTPRMSAALRTRAAHRLLMGIVVAGVCASEIWQLVRFGIW